MRLDEQNNDIEHGIYSEHEIPALKCKENVMIMKNYFLLRIKIISVNPSLHSKEKFNDAAQNNH